MGTRRDRDEFLGNVQKIRDNPRTFEIDVSRYSWKSKAREFEDLLEDVIPGAEK